jgi:hypothetical protein
VKRELQIRLADSTCLKLLVAPGCKIDGAGAKRPCAVAIRT